MPDIYADMYSRAQIGDPGTIPISGTITHSPDIIPYGTSPVNDPQTLFKGNWNTDVGRSIEENRTNYVYVRGMNNYSGAQTAKVYAYGLPCAVINWPFKYAQYELTTSKADSSGNPVKFTEVSAAKAGDIYVGTEPFAWTAQPLPAGSSHYCVITRTSTAQNPNPLPSSDPGDFSSYDMAEFIHNNRGFAWRNVSMVNNDAPTWTESVEFSQPLPGTLELYVVLAVHGDLIGCDVAFSCGTTKGLDQPLNLVKTPVTQINQVLGVHVKVDQHFDSYISVSLWKPGGKDIKQGDGMTLKALTDTDGSEKMTRLCAPHEVHGIRHIAQAFGIGPTVCTPLGDFNWRYAK